MASPSGWTRFYATMKESSAEEVIACAAFPFLKPLVLDKEYALENIKRDARRALGLTPSSAEPNYRGAPPPTEFPIVKLAIKNSDLFKLFLSADVDVDKPGLGSAILTFRMRMSFPFSSPGKCEMVLAPSGHMVSYAVDVVTVDGAGVEVGGMRYYNKVKTTLDKNKRSHRAHQ